VLNDARFFYVLSAALTEDASFMEWRYTGEYRKNDLKQLPITD
jgi:hypothetical protein